MSSHRSCLSHHTFPAPQHNGPDSTAHAAASRNTRRLGSTGPCRETGLVSRRRHLVHLPPRAQRMVSPLCPCLVPALINRYMYSWASEVFATICAAIFFPVNLEQLARENGVYAYDRLTPCTADLNITSHSLATSVSTSMFSDMSLSVLGATEDKTRCVVHFLGITWMDSSSFALYTFSISTFLQAVLVVSMSGAADYGNLSFYRGD